MRGWATAFGSAVWQRTVRQETTIAKHGSLPECMHQFTNAVTARVHLRDLPSNDQEDLASNTEGIVEEEDIVSDEEAFKTILIKID